MAFCRNCGYEIDEMAQVCPVCGGSQPVKVNVVDNGGFGWGLLGCCVPIAGLILYIVWKDTKPKTAKAAGIGALVSTILGVLYYVALIVIGIIAAFAGSY